MSRSVGLDVGERRIGVAVSDASGVLARAVGTLQVARLDARAVDAAADEIARLGEDDDPVSTIVVGLPKRLDGSPNDMTSRIERFADALRARTGLDVVLQDERLTSHEAEQRLARTEKDWRVRKQRIDAEAASIILQDYLDTRPGRIIPFITEPEF